MALSRGFRIGVYDIIAPLGAGGMGEVYRARDIKLDRDVALKILPEAFADDADRLARFEREAKVLATLNHPNIAHVYGLTDFARGASSEKDSGRHAIALVMELVEGEDLAQKIARGAILLSEALPLARQISEALEAAHEQGIIHRDLKPANIKVREDGTVKVLDFGLAKAIAPVPVGNVTASPTLTGPAMTQAGMVLGTAAYMAPEQARGRTVDRRADIWAFGCVLYEMLTGQRAFAGDDVSDVLASVLAREPDWTRLPAGISPMLRTCLQRCLIKDARQRLRDAGDLRLVLEGAFDSAAAAVVERPARSERPAWIRVLPWTLAVLSSVVAAALLVLWAPWKTPPASPAVHLSAVAAAGATLGAGAGGIGAVISPDGGTLAFIGTVATNSTRQILVRRLNELGGTPLPGTENAANPFFSPDGNWIAFSSSGKLRKVPTGGGAVVPLANAANLRGGTWTRDGWIVFAAETTGVLSRVPASGGVPEPATTLGTGEVSHRWPQVLDGQTIMYSASDSPTSWADASLIIQDVPLGSRTVVHQGGHYGRLLPNGFLVFVRSGVLFGAPFDAARRQLAGAPVPVLDAIASFDPSGAAPFSFSETGTLVYLAGEGVSVSQPMAWIDRAGQVTTLRSESANWSNPQFSPDGKRLAIDVADGPNTDVFIDDWAANSMKRLTLEPSADLKPVWTPDGRHVTYSSARGDKSTLNLYSQRADGAGDAARLTESANNQLAGSWHPSGKYLAFTETRQGTGQDILILPVEGDTPSGLKPGKPTDFLSTPAAESEPVFSPDGRWIAYQSNALGTTQLFVQRFPGPGNRWQVSTEGGVIPTWSRTRAELLYRSLNNSLMVVPYRTEGEVFVAETARPMGNIPIATRPRQRYFNLHPDGNRFVASPPPPAAAPQDKAVFVFNFFDELRRTLAPRP